MRVPNLRRESCSRYRTSRDCPSGDRGRAVYGCGVAQASRPAASAFGAPRAVESFACPAFGSVSSLGWVGVSISQAADGWNLNRREHRRTAAGACVVGWLADLVVLSQEDRRRIWVRDGLPMPDSRHNLPTVISGHIGCVLSRGEPSDLSLVLLEGSPVPAACQNRCRGDDESSDGKCVIRSRHALSISIDKPRFSINTPRVSPSRPLGD